MCVCVWGGGGGGGGEFLRLRYPDAGKSRGGAGWVGTGGAGRGWVVEVVVRRQDGV